MRYWALIVVVAAIAVPSVSALSSQYGDPPSAAATGEGQLRTAIQHAKELGATSSALSGVQTHLQHTINCLEGPRGKNFNAQAGNPCQGQGTGFLNDAKDKAGAVFLAQHADALAVDALKSAKDVATAQAAARSVAAILEEAMKLLK